MLSRLILDEELPSGRSAVMTRHRGTTWEGLREQAQEILARHANVARRRVGLSFSAEALSYAALAALERLGCDVFLLDAHLTLPEVRPLAQKLKLGALLTKPSFADGLEVEEIPGEGEWSGSSTVTILTSGSTGEPKAARHSWEGIARPVRKTPGLREAPVWLLTYRPNLYAGLQVMLQCFSDRGTLCLPDREMDPQAVARFMAEAGVRFVSATPSYWRRLLMFAENDLLRRIPIGQVTLGGEVVDQAVLDNLRRLYPNARLVHIYATTELGRCFSVGDGLAGFPSAYLEGPLADGAELKIEDGELLVRSANAMRMYDPLSPQAAPVANWFATGDLVEVHDGRVFFVGRRSEMINVAGAKVYPIEVERTIREIPGVVDVRVFGKASSIAGELVACEVVPAEGQDPRALREAIGRICRGKLTGPQQPRLIKFLDRIDLSSAGKTLRTKAS
jgi:acyl-CoA synthetase (AMP-forming)/AMP-acid ligase II